MAGVVLDSVKEARTMYSRPSMSFLLMTLQAKYWPVLMWTASLTIA